MGAYDIKIPKTVDENNKKIIDENSLSEMGYRQAQIDEIKRGYEAGVDVSVYAHSKFDWKQMRQLRLGLEDKLDVSIYNNPFFSAGQMQEIRLGLLEHVDVNSYARLIFSVTDMRVRRKKSFKAVYNGGIDYSRTITDEMSGLKIRISKDYLRAYAMVPAECEFDFTRNDVISILKRNGIIIGIKKDAAERVASQANRGMEFLVAEGFEAEKGEDGYFERLVTKGKVTVDTPLVKYNPPQTGLKGITVTGMPIDAILGQECRKLRLKGVVYDELFNKYVAQRDGYMHFDEKNSVLKVEDIININHGLTSSHGDQEYFGAVRIKGNIIGPIKIIVDGDFFVEGEVEDATIKASGSVTISGGVYGKQRGSIHADGDVSAKFFKGIKIRTSGDINAEYFQACDIETDGSVVAEGEKSKIIGGSIVAGDLIQADYFLKPTPHKMIIKVKKEKKVEPLIIANASLAGGIYICIEKDAVIIQADKGPTTIDKEFIEFENSKNKYMRENK